MISARTIDVRLGPELGRALASTSALAPAVPGPSSPDERVVLPVLLGPGEDVAQVRAPFPVVDLGTGFLHGYAIAHLALARRDLDAASTLQILTRPASGPVAVPLRPGFPDRVEARRSVQNLVVNPDAVALYPGRQLAALPVESPARAFVPAAMPSLEGSPVRMLILTRDALASTFQGYADYWTGLGVPTAVRTVEWVTQNYPTGADLAETLRDFLRQAYSLWGIRSVLLGGDTELVPTRYASSVYSLEGDTVPTDLYYACLDGDWNGDRDARWGEGYVFGGSAGDQADLYPELLVGRLPVTTPEQVSLMRSKLASYMEPTDVVYQTKLLFLAEVIWPAAYRVGDPIMKNGADNAERIIQQNSLATPLWTLCRLYETPTPYPGSTALTRSAALDAMGAGYGIVTDIGHGFRYTMSLGDASMTNVNATALANASRPFFLNMLNCSAGAFDFPCLAEKFLLNPTGGAVGVIGSAREAYPDNIQLYQEAWFNKLLRDGFAAAAEALNEARLRYVAQTYEDGAYRWSDFITAYLGDPELELWRAPPIDATVGVAASIPVGTRELAVSVSQAGTPVVGATVCLWKPGDFYAVSHTNLSGLATVRITAESPGGIQLAVRGAGIRVHRGTVAVTPVPGPALRVAGTPTVQDSGSGSGGNGNGQLDAGETAMLRFRVENTGGVATNGVTLQLLCSEPALTVSTATWSIGTLAPGASVLSPPVPVAVAPNALDQQRVRVDAMLRNSLGGSWTDRVDLDLLQCAPRVLRQWVDDKGIGNGTGAPDAGETYDLKIDLKNYGFGSLDGATGQLLSVDPDVTILAPTTTFGTLAHLGIASGSFRLRETRVTETNRMTFLVSDVRGRLWSFPVETRRPSPPANVAADASVGPGSVQVTWTGSSSPDVVGYVVYRAPSRAGPWQRASVDLVRHAVVFQETGLQSGTRYAYNVSAVDSSGNESLRTPTLELTTNPALVAGWPQALGIWSNSSPVLADLDGDLAPEIVVGSADHVYAWRPSGTEVRDGDANPTTRGVFAAATGNFMPGLAAGDLDHDGRDEIVACTFDTRMVYVFEGDGSVRPGWPRPIVSTTHGIWATPALGDLDMDGSLDIVVLGLDGRLYAWHANGTEIRDGDSNPATQGVFYVVPGASTWSRGAPAIANLLPSDAAPEIVFGTETSQVYVLRANGSVAPGWPRTVGGFVDSAPSIGDIDGDGALEIAVPARDGVLYVFRRDGTQLAGWPRPLPNVWNAITPSVALADFDGDGRLELVAASTGATTEEGSVYVFDWQGNLRPGWPVDVHSASESSPVVGDIDSDGKLEIVFGGESGVLHGLRADGSMQPGFPIRLGAEIRATPLLGDADRDGRIDLLFSGWDQQVYLWRMPGLYTRRNVPWPTQKGNVLRNGVYGYREPTDTGGTTTAPPQRTALHQNVPNPFNPATQLGFDIAGTAPQPVRLAIFDARGRRVRILVDRALAPGRYSEPWDGRDDGGHLQPSGVYFSRLDTAEESAVRKLVLVR